MERLGNYELLSLRRIGFLAGSKIAALSVLPTMDWAAETARREDVAVVSGFHSHLERQALEFLLHGRCGIVCVLARSMYSRPLEIFKEPVRQGRVLFLSQEKGMRASRQTA